MRPENQEARRRQIEAAAYELLTEQGYRATSMLAIARRASASNETLYKWYGNKQTLFRSLVESNAKEVTELLQAYIDNAADIQQTLERVGPVLLRMVTGDRAVSLNRAAASDADETGILGETLSRAGRGSVAPLIGRAFERSRERGELDFPDTKDAVDIYLSLLIGDLQIRRATGALQALGENELQHRADRAWRILHRLFGRESTLADSS